MTEQECKQRHPWSKCHVLPLINCHALHASLSVILTPYLFSSFLNNKEGIRPIRNHEGEPVSEGVAAIMAVADPVLVDVFHGEGGGVLGTLPIAGSLDGAMAWGLHNAECDRLSLLRREKTGGEGKCITETR